MYTYIMDFFLKSYGLIISLGIDPELLLIHHYSEKEVTAGMRKAFGNRADKLSPWFPGEGETV